MGRSTCLSLLFGTFVAASGAHAAGTILVSNNSSGTIGAYTTSGATVNASLITGLSNPGSLIVSGSDLFVELGGNTIGEYTIGGATVNAALITGLGNVHQISSFGSNIFVANGNSTNTIGEYTTAGATVNNALISGVDVAHGAASNGTDIFVVNNDTGGTGTGFISEYTTSGVLVNASLITGLSGPEEILILGSDIFVTNFTSGTVGEYTTSGGTVNAALISGLNGADGIATDGTNLYITNALGGTVSEYTTSGVLVNAALISGLSGPAGIAVVSGPLPAITSVVNGASFTSPVVAGGTATIYGTNIASSTASFGGAQPVPTILADTSVEIGGIAAPEYYVSQGQINIQVPWELAGQDQVFLTVTTAAGTSSPVAVSLISYDPDLFSIAANGQGQGWIVNSNNTFNGPLNPTAPGGTIQIGATDMGAVTNQPADGTAPSAPANTSAAPVGVAIGGLPAVVTASQLCGPSPFCPVPDSSYLITAQVPAGVAEGLAVPVKVTMGNVAKTFAVSNTVTMVVAYPGVTIEIPGLGCTTALGTDRFSVAQATYTTSKTSSAARLTITKLFDDCTTALFHLIASGGHVASLTMTRYDATGTQPLSVVTFQTVVVSMGDFGGSVKTPDPYETIVFGAKTSAVQ